MDRTQTPSCSALFLLLYAVAFLIKILVIKLVDQGQTANRSSQG